MTQIFRRSADTWLRVGLLLLIVGVSGGLLVALTLESSDYRTGRNWVVEQPLPFSHAHHAGELKIDCRYCHSAVQSSAMASLPRTETCMSCHSQVWKNADVLAPLRKSLREHEPLHWQRVVELPDYVYFHHGVHVNAGVGCSECHGQVDVLFLGCKGIEYGLEIQEGVLPGFAQASHWQVPSAQLSMNLYFIATALHGVHVLVAVGLALWLYCSLGRGSLAVHQADTRLEMISLYWHLVDGIWIVLFPTLYLVGR